MSFVPIRNFIPKGTGDTAREWLSAVDTMGCYRFCITGKWLDIRTEELRAYFEALLSGRTMARWTYFLHGLGDSRTYFAFDDPDDAMYARLMLS